MKVRWSLDVEDERGLDSPDLGMSVSFCIALPGGHVI